MKNIQVTLTFDPPQPWHKRGVWRVVYCNDNANATITRVDDFTQHAHCGLFAGRKVLRIMAARPYRVGVMVSPKQIALEHLRASDRYRIATLIEEFHTLRDSYAFYRHGIYCPVLAGTYRHPSKHAGGYPAGTHFKFITQHNNTGAH